MHSATALKTIIIPLIFSLPQSIITPIVFVITSTATMIVSSIIDVQNSAIVLATKLSIQKAAMMVPSMRVAHRVIFIILF